MTFKSPITGKKPMPTSNKNNLLGQTGATSGKTDATGKEGKGMYQGRDTGKESIISTKPIDPRGSVKDKGAQAFKPFY